MFRLRVERVIIDLIGSTTPAGLKIYARLGPGQCTKGVTASDPELAAVNIVRDDFHLEWNCFDVPDVAHAEGRPGHRRAERLTTTSRAV